MGIMTRLKEKGARPIAADPLPPAAPTPREELAKDLKELKKEIAFNDLKARIHARMIHLLDLSRLVETPDNLLMEDLRQGIERILAEERLALTLPDQEIALVLAAMVKARLNILISGGTGSGKTVFLNVLSSFIPNDERIITIEDSAELQLQQEHVVRLETRPPNLEGFGEVTQRDLVRNALRMRPERIILGEVRSGEALDMLQAMNTGHDGSLATIHANSPRDALARLETMVSMAGLNIPDRAIRHQISSAVHVIIQLARLSDGSRKMMNLFEIVGIEGDTITMQEIFCYELQGITENRKVKGKFVTRGIRPKFMKRLDALGIQLPAQVFQETEAD